MAKRTQYVLHLQEADYQTMAWKNGAGETKQIFIEPPNATLEKNDFLWRLSAAKLKAECTFSTFVGYDRILTLIDGRSVEIKRPQNNDLLSQGELLFFTGEEEVQANPKGGEVEDLGLIFSRQKVQAKAHILDFKTKVRSFELSSKTILYFAAKGNFLSSTYPGEINFMLNEGEILRIDREERQVGANITSFDPKTTGGRIICFEIN